MCAMSRDPTLARDASLALLIGAVASLPLFASSSPAGALRTQLKDLVNAFARAVALTVGTTAAVVLGGGAILAGERAWYRFKAWWWPADSTDDTTGDEQGRTPPPS